MPFVQQRRGTASELQTANELPLAGQIYYELDTNKLKVGDGSRRYNELPYLSESTTVADLDGLQGTLDANAAAAAAAAADAAAVDVKADALAVAVNTLSVSVTAARQTADTADGKADALAPIVISNTNAATAAQQTADTADGKADALAPIVAQNEIDVAAVTSTVTNLSSSFGSHANRHGTGGADPISPASIGAASTTDLQSVSSVANAAALDASTAVIAAGNALSDAATNAAAIAALTPASIGAQPAGTYATLVGGTIPAAQLPSYVDDVIEGTLATFPTTGDTGKIYVDTGTNKTYRWGGSTYVEIASSPGSTDVIAEGSVNLYYTNARADDRVNLQTGSNLDLSQKSTSDLPEGTSLYFTNARVLGLVGTTVNTICAGDDSRLSDARTPTAHTHPQSDINNLTTDLAAKAALTGATFSGVVSSATGGNSFLANQFASTATNPQYSFVNYTTTGMYMPGGNLLGFTVDGTAVFTCRAGLSQLGLPDGVIVSGKAEVTGDIEASGTAKFASLSDGTTTRSIADVMSPPWGYITGKPTTFAPSAHNHAISDLEQSSASTGQVITWNGTAWVASTPSSGSATDLDGLTDVTVSTPAVGEVLRHDGSEFVNAVLGISDITNLQTELNGKASTSHNHSLASLSDTSVSSSPLAGSFLKYNGVTWQATYADIPAVNGLQAALDSKVESDTTQAGGGTAVNNLVVISQTDYNNLPTKDANTIYFIT